MSEKEENKKIATVRGQTVKFTILFIVFCQLIVQVLTYFALMITGFTELHSDIFPMLWGAEFVTYLLSISFVTALLFGPKAKKVVAKEEVPKLTRNVNLAFVIPVILFTVLGIMSVNMVGGGYTVSETLIYSVINLVAIVIGVFIIRKILNNTLKIRMLYVGLFVLAVFILGLILFFTGERAYVITTGRFGHGTEEYNEIANNIFGAENTQERFELYFNWYNVVHEIGHAIVSSNSDLRLHPMDEEQLVNDFTVAFWAHHGEEGDLDKLKEIVVYGLQQFERPVDENTTHMEYGRNNWGRGDFFSFNNYGWLQFSSVYYSLQDIRSLEEILSEMGVENINVQPQIGLIYESVGEDMVEQIIYDTVSILREWGAVLPSIYHRFSDNPANHNLLLTRNMLGILNRMHNLAIGN